MNLMEPSSSSMAQQVARAVSDYHQQRTGRAPKSVTVVLSEDTLVVTLHEALSRAETELARTASGMERVQEFYRQLFTTSSLSLQHEIKRITGVVVREAAEVAPTTGAMVQVFTSGTMVQIFMLEHSVTQETWNKGLST